MIRKAKSEDAERITRIHLNSWKTTYSKFFPREVFDNQEKEYLKRVDNIRNAIIENSLYHYVVYEKDNEILGFACYGDARGDEYNGYGEVYSIYLEEENKKNGIGTVLINNCFEKLINDGKNKIIIRCLNGNNASEFYKKLGGRVIAQENGKVGDIEIVEDIYFLEK